MGLMLDSSVVIRAERRKETPEQFIEQLTKEIPDQPLAVSAIALTEIVHAVSLAPDPEIRLRREIFIRQRSSFQTQPIRTTQPASLLQLPR